MKAPGPESGGHHLQQVEPEAATSHPGGALSGSKGWVEVQIPPGIGLKGRPQLIFLFVCLWLRWVFTAACGLSLVPAGVGYSLAVMPGLLVAEHRL